MLGLGEAFIAGPAFCGSSRVWVVLRLNFQLHDAAAGGVLLGDGNQNLVAGPKPHKIHFLRSGRMRQKVAAAAVEFDSDEALREEFQNFCRYCLHVDFQGRVSTQGPFLVTATQCSK